MEEEEQLETRNPLIRGVALILWMPVFYIVTNMLVGAVVGGIAGSKTHTAEEGYAAGQQASIAFFQHYGHIVLAVQGVVFLLLAILGAFPGTRRYKK